MQHYTNVYSPFYKNATDDTKLLLSSSTNLVLMERNILLSSDTLRKLDSIVVSIKHQMLKEKIMGKSYINKTKLKIKSLLEGKDFGSATNDDFQLRNMPNSFYAVTPDTVDSAHIKVACFHSFNKCTLSFSCNSPNVPSGIDYEDLGKQTRFTIVSEYARSVITIDFGTVEGKIKSDESSRYHTFLWFKEQVNNNFIFIGCKQRSFGICYENIQNFVLIYNKNDGFNYIFSPFITTSSSPWESYYNPEEFMEFAFVRDNKHRNLICCDFDNNRLVDDNEGSKIDKNIYVYNIKNNQHVATIKVGCYEQDELCYSFLSSIGEQLVYVEYTLHNNEVKFIWINVEYWEIDDTIVISANTDEVVDIKLIGIHGYLSAIFLSYYNDHNFKTDVYYL